MKKKIILILILLFWGCQKTEIMDPSDQISKIELQVNGLNAPGDSVWYECWLMWTVGEGESRMFESIGLLTDHSGTTYSKSVDVNPGFLQESLHLLISMEEDTYPGFRIVPNATSFDTLKGPSINKIIAAKLAANSGTFDVGNDIILDFDFQTAQSKYIIDAPTDTSGTNRLRGIWFVKLDTTFKEIKDSTGAVTGIDTTLDLLNGLDLPELPDNWFYEGWIVFGSDTVSMGTFTNPIGADDSSKYGAGLGGGYNFPGEDFINNPPAGVTFPADISGSEIFITILPPSPEKANKPFNLIPFKATIPANSTAKQNYSMENNSISFPDGNLSITLMIYEEN